MVFSYRYQTRAGTVSLVPDSDGRYRVIFHDEVLGSYHSAQAAADDVSGGHTFSASDGTDFAELDIPCDIGEWDRRWLVICNLLPPKCLNALHHSADG